MTWENKKKRTKRTKQDESVVSRWWKKRKRERKRLMLNFNKGMKWCDRRCAPAMLQYVKSKYLATIETHAEESLRDLRSSDCIY